MLSSFRLSFLCCIAGAIILFCDSCTLENGNTNTPALYSIASYFKGEAARLKQQHIQLDKEIQRDGKRERKHFVSIDWNQELQPFIDCDLNKPAWASAYKTDSVIAGDSLLLTYSANEDRLPVKEMKLCLVGKELVAVDIHTEKKNNYFMTKQQLHYSAKSSYRIEGMQKVILADSTNFIVEGKFIH